MCGARLSGLNGSRFGHRAVRMAWQCAAHLQKHHGHVVRISAATA